MGVPPLPGFREVSGGCRGTCRISGSRIRCVSGIPVGSHGFLLEISYGRPWYDDDGIMDKFQKEESEASSVKDVDSVTAAVAAASISDTASSSSLIGFAFPPELW